MKRQMYGTKGWSAPFTAMVPSLRRVLRQQKARRAAVGATHDGEQGFTLMLTLGFLGVLLIIMLSLAVTAHTERRSASVASDLIRSRMFARSGLERAMAYLETQFKGDVYPGTTFYRPGTGSPWNGRGYLASVNGADVAGIQEALSVTLAGAQFTPSDTLHPSVGWIPVKSSQRVGNANVDVLVGRYAFLMIDESGKIDPTMAVSETEPEYPGVTQRVGASPAEICLADAGLSSVDLFRSETATNGPAGKMPSGARWFSVNHIIRALQPSSPDLDAMLKSLHPFSEDTEKFWRDKDGDGVWSSGEDEDRLDLAATLSLTELYELFVGADKLSTDDDCEWLKELDNNAWVQAWKASAGISTLQARQRVAGQIAANVIDYADPDSIPTPANIDALGELIPGTTDLPGTYSIFGVENTWGVSEIALRVDTTIITTPAQPGACDIAGDININPGNSTDHYFTMSTSAGTIDRDTLMANGAGYSYQGPASSVKFRPKAQGRTLVINGQSVQLANTTYTITSSSMTVFLRNLNPGAKKWAQAMGHWWLEISATNVSITPDPGIPPPIPVPTALRVTPGFRGEIYYPFATGADTTDPPGDLTVTYSIIVETATGEVGMAQGSIRLPLTQSTNVDGGTMMYSADYEDAEFELIVNAFDMAVIPPADWYRVADAKITAVTLQDPNGRTIDSMPVGAGGDQDLYLCDWTQSGCSTTSAVFYASLHPHDPLSNDRGERDQDFLDYWTVLPDTVSLSGADQSDFGSLGVTPGYDSADFCDVKVANSPFVRLGEIGLVHSYEPMRSLRLWSADASGEQGHDADILDLFKIGPDTLKKGRVNINSMQRPVLEALFEGAVTPNTSSAVDAVFLRRQSGVTFKNIGDLFGGIAGVSGASPADDDVEERAVSKLAELVTVRQNYYTIIACAQAIKDIANVRYDSDGDGSLDKVAGHNQLDIRRDANGNVVSYVDRILAEQKILAVVYRDAYSGQTRLERFEYLSD